VVLLTGFPFDRFIAALMRYQYQHVKVGEVVKGFCVDHEIDVVVKTKDKN